MSKAKPPLIERTSKIEKVTGWINRLSAFVAIPAIVAIVTIDVVRRYFFNSPLIWANEITGYLLLAVFLLAIPHCSAQGRHIRIDLLYPRLPDWAQRLVDILTDVTGLLLGAAIAWQSVLNARDHFEFRDAGAVSDFPFWPLDLLMTVCGLLLVLVFSVALLRARAPASDRGIE